jgi:hypothetical protein
MTPPCTCGLAPVGQLGHLIACPAVDDKFGHLTATQRAQLDAVADALTDMATEGRTGVLDIAPAQGEQPMTWAELPLLEEPHP